MSESKEGPRTVKVVDRRMFSADGTPREDLRPEESTPQQPERPAAQAPPPREPARPASPPRADAAAAPAAAGGATSQLFLALVRMLAQNAELLMVGAEGLPAQPEEARHFIDILAALEAKTAGNLSPEEAAILTDLVFQLRAAYVQSRR